MLHRDGGHGRPRAASAGTAQAVGALGHGARARCSRSSPRSSITVQAEGGRQTQCEVCTFPPPPRVGEQHRMRRSRLAVLQGNAAGPAAFATLCCPASTRGPAGRGRWPLGPPRTRPDGRRGHGGAGAQRRGQATIRNTGGRRPVITHQLLQPRPPGRSGPARPRGCCEHGDDDHHDEGRHRRARSAPTIVVARDATSAGACRSRAHHDAPPGAMAWHIFPAEVGGGRGRRRLQADGAHFHGRRRHGKDEHGHAHEGERCRTQSQSQAFSAKDSAKMMTLSQMLTIGSTTANTGWETLNGPTWSVAWFKSSAVRPATARA